ncbi:family 16 glycosylhydrolase [Anaerocolumna xylanovorans]|uniref:Beta-glucanase, GH16 family n=1 Tax=Anaerocolumna xylanovorans DSM 12503 TaxID=1121345 RepID=A0A1M7YE49_9FIRM|nr:family 16 glycosylhydrolase [Anaerocolumna xylanovorans]SHO50871.1 Beta-glucanase, GH16 family [Anaerocolumna xylanovorans DSM 12503]
MGKGKRKKRIALYFKRAAVAMLVMVMLLQPIPGTAGSSVKSVEAAVTTGDYIDLQNTATELWVGGDNGWGGSHAAVSENGTKATIDISNFGVGENEWTLQYMVKDLGLKSSTKYQVEFDITSTIDKEVFIKLDDTGLIEDSINLTEGTKYHYSKESAAGTLSADKQFLYFALGRKGSEANDLNGTVTIENVKVEEVNDTETAADITVNKKGTSVKFQLEKDAAAATAKVYYAVCASEALADTLSVGDAAFKECIMSKKANGIWEVSDTVALADGQVIRYYFDKDGVAATPVNYTFSGFTAVDYTYDNQADLAAEGFSLAWADEFNGTELDPNKWSFQIGTKDPNGGPDYWGNQEKEYYTDSNHAVKDGKLVITAKQESKEGMPYTSTRIRTKTDAGDTLYAARYGRIEARMKLPAEEGLWPAFWMLPADTSTYGTWAASGELDIMEARGRVPDKVGGTIHFGSQWPNNTYYGKEKTLDSSTDIGAYHLYSVEWEPGKITWLVDDVPYFSTGNFWSKDSGSAENYAYGAPFDVPFYLILNLAVGGTFDGAANLGNAEFPADMEVDYVRVYKKSDAYYQNLEDNLTTPETDRDKTSFESPAYQPAGVDGDYVKDTAFDTLKTVTEVKPDDTDWQFFVGAFGGEATVTKDTIDGTAYAKASITKGGDQNYAIQLIKHFPFASGYTYEISFDGLASVNREFLLKPCGDADNGWAGYGTSKTFGLTTTMTHYTHQFTMDKDSDPTARLEFDLGREAGDVWIGNVVVKQVEPEKADTTDIFKNPDQNGGNHIYNGSFDQGAGRLAFWRTENVAVNVPGVINQEYDAVTGDKGDFSRRALVTANDSNARIYQNGIWLQQSDIYQLSLNLSSQAATKVSAVLTNKDGSRVYMKKNLDVTGTGTEGFTVNFAMPKGVTDKEAVFSLVFEKGSTVSADNIRLVRTTNNNVTIDYSGVVLEPVKTDSTGWINNLNNGGSVTPAANQDGEITSQTVTNQLNYMSMLYVPVSVKKGITYHLSFQAKSQYNNSVMLNIQEDNSWAVTLEGNLNMKAEEWQEFNYTLNSTLTNGSNPIFLKFLLSGPDVIAGTFKVKNVSMTAEVLEGAKDAPADTILSSNPPVEGSDYVIALKDGDYKTKFFNCVEKPDRKALVMVNGSALPDGSVKDGTIVIPASILGRGAYTIELALDGFNSITLLGTVKDAVNPGSNPGNNTADNNKKVTDAAAPVIVTQPAGGKYVYNEAAASLSVRATGDGTLSYQWYKNNADTASGASAISGATGASYTPSTAKVGKAYYYCVVTNTNKEATGVKDATATTNLVTVEVTKAANTITGVGNVSTVYGSAAFTLTAKAKGTITYKSSNPKVVAVDSKSGRVVIKGTGKATITVTADGSGNYKAGVKKITVTVTPKKATVTSLKSGRANSLTVAWAKDTRAAGYEIQYSTGRDFSNAKTVTVSKNVATTKTISKLKGGKTYYVRVRAYTKSGTAILTGSWSAAKKVVVKK